MARPRKSEATPKQGPPVAFRAGPDLSRLVTTFAEGRKVSVHEAFKNLAALAAVGLDVRYYDLLSEMAGRRGGHNPFVRAVLEVSSALTAAARVEAGYAHDPGRAALVIVTVRDHVVAAGGRFDAEIARVLLARLGIKPNNTAWFESEEIEETEAQSAKAAKQKAEKLRTNFG